MAEQGNKGTWERGVPPVPDVPDVPDVPCVPNVPCGQLVISNVKRLCLFIKLMRSIPHFSVFSFQFNMRRRHHTFPFNIVILRRGNRDYDGCNHALCPDVRIYRCFSSLEDVVLRISTAVNKGRLPQNCTETEWASAR